MKNSKKILITVTVLATIGVAGVRAVNRPDPYLQGMDSEITSEEVKNEEVTSEKITSEEVKKDSLEVAKLKKNFHAFKQNERKNLAIKYNLDESSNIDVTTYSDAELQELQSKYPNANNLGEALALENEEEFEQEYVEVENYVDEKLEQSVLDNESPIYMPDNNLKQAVITTLDIDVDELYAKHLYHLTELELSNLEITSLEGIEYAINLEKLDLSNSTIANPIILKPLGMLGELKEINLLGIFRPSYEGGLNYLPKNVEKVYVEDFWNTEGFNFTTSAEIGGI